MTCFVCKKALCGDCMNVYVDNPEIIIDHESISKVALNDFKTNILLMYESDHMIDCNIDVLNNGRMGEIWVLYKGSKSLFCHKNCLNNKCILPISCVYYSMINTALDNLKPPTTRVNKTYREIIVNLPVVCKFKYVRKMNDVDIEYLVNNVREVSNEPFDYKEREEFKINQRLKVVRHMID